MKMLVNVPISLALFTLACVWSLTAKAANCVSPDPALEQFVASAFTGSGQVSNRFSINNYGQLVQFQRVGGGAEGKANLTLALPGAPCDLIGVEAVEVAGQEDVFALSDSGQVSQYQWTITTNWGVSGSLNAATGAPPLAGLDYAFSNSNEVGVAGRTASNQRVFIYFWFPSNRWLYSYR